MILWWLLSCGAPSDFCDRERAWREGCGEVPTNAELRGCQQSLRTCSDPDLALLDDYIGCLEEAPCDATAFFGCAALLEGLDDPDCGAGG